MNILLFYAYCIMYNPDQSSPVHYSIPCCSWLFFSQQLRRCKSDTNTCVCVAVCCVSHHEEESTYYAQWLSAIISRFFFSSALRFLLTRVCLATRKWQTPGWLVVAIDLSSLKVVVGSRRERQPPPGSYNTTCLWLQQRIRRFGRWLAGGRGCGWFQETK